MTIVVTTHQYDDGTTSTVESYACDSCSRGITGEVGRITRRLLRNMDAVRSAHLATLYGTRPEVLCAECFHLAGDVINKAAMGAQP